MRLSFSQLQASAREEQCTPCDADVERIEVKTFSLQEVRCEHLFRQPLSSPPLCTYRNYIFLMVFHHFMIRSTIPPPNHGARLPWTSQGSTAGKNKCNNDLCLFNILADGIYVQPTFSSMYFVDEALAALIHVLTLFSLVFHHGFSSFHDQVSEEEIAAFRGFDRWC